MSTKEDRALLEKPLDQSVPMSESSDSSTCGCRRLPLSVFWIWVNLIVCGVSNQRLPESVLEDELNKPWRPIAAKRLTPDQAQKLLLTIIPLVMGMSLFIGGFAPSVTMMALLWTYNDLDGSSINIWSRNLINTGGIMCFSAGSLEVISGGQLLPKAWIWIGLTGAAIATTVQALDFPDMQGDWARGRQTIPLVYGEKASRTGLAVAVLMWSAVSPYFWNLSLVGWAVPMGFGSVMAVLTVARRDEKCDKIVAKLWCLWMSTLFFWFFEARKAPENAPLAIWLNGGPGASSIMGLLEENGPCFVNEDSKTTRLNPLSWNNEVNLLYIDQPNQVGFSYDVLTNLTAHMNEEGYMESFPADFSDGIPESGNWTYRYGTASSQNISQTAHTTAHAAHSLWHFAQTWFFEFPFYKPIDDKVSLWAESYGGHYGPGILKHFQNQNELIQNGSSPEKDAHYIHLDTLGIVNGLIDFVIQAETWITFPYNNTYDIQVFNQSIYDELIYNWTRPNGCRQQMADCQDALKEHGPLLASGKKNYTEICGGFTSECENKAVGLYQSIGNGWYDIGHPKHDPFPAPHLYGYLIDEEVLSSLGVPVNYSESSSAVGRAFNENFDIILGGFSESIGYLLDSGVKVHMMYGDRDYACNWVGGERVSLTIPYKRSEDFAKAGYAPLVTPDGITGMTRQFGNYSFSRVFQAGHEVPSYQPVTAYEIFMRATFNRDIATGLIPVTDELATVGPLDIWHIKNVPPAQPDPACYVLKPDTCAPEVWEMVKNGTALVRDYYVVGTIEEDGDEQVTQTIQGPEKGEQQVAEEL
ncbi:hypothetical protein COL26b_007191 [Colletotrichum chrysophilum]|uniref:uncharacterized protein n=1 Tax=Colletotrichum chrysophilum TaxID=1836956 RepID=UPI002300FE12|nr:uncharacterized protein COL26b_007191 [Colletotrichum chrysophilum]KAJ0374572.1 hypothetical protein COL26b_007191 [Colletotrichum chrysophilum]